MITQVFLDWLSGFIGFLIGLAPAFSDAPAAFQQSIDFVLSGATALAPSVAALGAILPFNAVGDVLALVPAALAFWGLALGVRALLWALGR